MADLSPPWIRADFTGITDGPSVNTLTRLKCLLEGFAQEALLHNVDTYDLKLAFQDILENIEHKRLCGQHIDTFIPSKAIHPPTPIKSNGGRKPVASVTPLPLISAVAK